MGHTDQTSRSLNPDNTNETLEASALIKPPMRHFSIQKWKGVWRSEPPLPSSSSAFLCTAPLLLLRPRSCHLDLRIAGQTWSSTPAMAGRQADEAVYPYQRLDNASEIRVLELQPGLWKDNIHGHLRTVSRNDAKYEALSYVWGPRTEERILCLDKKHTVPITDNLFLALRRLRKRWTIRTLWVDAVCINQLDDIEKSSQVASMADIYREAEIVNIWLGDSPSARSIHLKCAFAFDIYSVWIPTCLMRPSRYLRRVLNSLLSDVAWFCHRLGPQSETQGAASSVESWHTRIWTLQEFLLAQKARLCIGGAKLVWQPHYDTSLFPLKSKRHDPIGLRLHLSGDDLDSIDRRLLDYEHFRARGKLVDILRMTSSTSATDPRDMVYGILGIIDEGTQRLIQPDYTLTYAEVCAAATVAALRTSTIEILSYVKLNAGEDTSRASWAVEFAEKHRTELAGNVRHRLRRGIKIASFESTTLGLPGRILGTAVECKAILASDVATKLQKYMPVSFESHFFNSFLEADSFESYTNQASGSTCLVRLSNGVEALGPGVVQPGDQLVRLCYVTPFMYPDSEVFVWLRPNGDCFIFRGLGHIPGETAYIGDYDGIDINTYTDNRTEAEQHAGFEVFLVR